MCLARRIEAEEGEGWICLRCGEVVKECRPWHGDVEVVSDEMRSRAGRKSLAWADQLVDDKENETDVLDQVEPMPVEDDVAED